MSNLSRRSFLALGAASAVTPCLLARSAIEPRTSDPMFKISLAQWSYNGAFFGRRGEKKDPLKFAEIAKKDHGIDAVEYVNQFYAKFKKDDAYLKDLKKVADDNGVKSVLIMCDGEGNLGDPDETKRNKAVDNHKRWLEWAVFLGCHSIRVNAASDWKKGFEETQKLAADGLSKLNKVGAEHKIGVIVENHGGLSSHGGWLAGVMKMVGDKNCGTLPDFGNFRVGKVGGYDKDEYDRYQGVDELMPFAKGVSAKSHDFDEKGNETKTDFRKMLQICLVKHKFRGFIGIEYEGSKEPEAKGVELTKKLLETVRKEMGQV